MNDGPKITAPGVDDRKRQRRCVAAQGGHASVTMNHQYCTSFAVMAVIAAVSPCILAQSFQPSAAASEVVAELKRPAPPEGKDAALQEAIESVTGPESSRVQFRGHLQTSMTFNPDAPRDRQNFGRLFDDRSNDWRLNQLMLTAEQAVDHELAFDWGFKAQFMIGTDARFTHVTGTFEDLTLSAIQLDPVDLSAMWHFQAGIDWDLKIGCIPSLCGLEAIDASATVPLFSRSYIFNFGVPLKHTGVFLTAGVDDDLQLFAGIDTGTNTGFTDNNNALGFHGGAIGKVCGGKVSYTLATHIAPDNPSAFATIPGVDPDSDPRAFVDLALTWTVNDQWTVMADLNYGHDEGALGLGGTDPEWYGAAGYVVWKASDEWTFALRGEVFRDDDGFAVIQFAEDDDYLDLLHGNLAGLDPRTVGGGATTYYGLTLAANWAPCENTLVQFEARYDWSDGLATPFDDSTDDDQFTLSMGLLYRF